jgi:hypothetical protein
MALKRVYELKIHRNMPVEANMVGSNFNQDLTLYFDSARDLDNAIAIVNRSPHAHVISSQEKILATQQAVQTFVTLPYQAS